MRSVFKTLKAFLLAEEVPRWFGLSVLLIYLVGLGVVSRSGINHARREASEYYEASGRYAINALVDRLAAVERRGSSERELAIGYRLALRDFAAHLPVSFLRVVDDERRVIASTEESEVGKIASGADLMTVPESGVEVTFREGDPDPLFRARVTLGNPISRGSSARSESVGAELPEGAALASSSEPLSVVFLEAQLPSGFPTGTGIMNNASAMIVVLVVLGSLFLVYRCLRQQLRGMSQIAQRLEAHGDRVKEELSSLRISDTIDSATSAWNQLIDLAESSLEAVHRSEANVELSRVLERSGGGALSEALNALPDGVMYITDEVRFEYVNSAGCRLFGWDAKEVKGLTLSEVEAEGVGAMVLDLVRGAAQSDGSYSPRSEVVSSGDGDACDTSTYRVWVIPLNRPHHQGECIVIIRDVSQQIRADRAREEFVTQVTHELRTPLTNIRAYAETLSSGMFDDPNVVTECYNVITKETRRLSRLIEDILSISQLEVGSIELQVDNVDLKALLSDGVRDVRGLGDEKNVDVQLVLPSKLEPIRGDRDKLAVVVNNLLGNAIKYTRRDGNVMVGCQVTGDGVVITVKDNGIGIAPSDHARVFEKFQRAEDEEVQKESGSGIGLYTAREIVRRHGGDIELISAKGEGATFMVRLPHRETRATSMSTTQAS